MTGSRVWFATACGVSLVSLACTQAPAPERQQDDASEQAPAGPEPTPTASEPPPAAWPPTPVIPAADPPACSDPGGMPGSLRLVDIDARADRLPMYFDASGQFAATAEDARCHVWRLADGAYVGNFATGCKRWPGGVDPCVDWESSHSIGGSGLTVRDTLTIDVSRYGIHISDSATDRRFLVGQKQGDEYVAVAISSDGKRFAAALESSVEIRSVADGSLLTTLPLSKPGRGQLVGDPKLDWSGTNPVIVFEVDACPDSEGCPYPDSGATSFFYIGRWTKLAGPPKLTRFSPRKRLGNALPSVYTPDVDPLGRLMELSYSYESGDLSYTEVIALEPSAARIARNFEPRDKAADPPRSFVNWLSGSSTALLIETLTELPPSPVADEEDDEEEDDETDDGPDPVEETASWELFELSPLGGRGRGELCGSTTLHVSELRAVGHRDGQALFAKRCCDERSCPPSSASEWADCTAHGLSFDGERVLFRCGAVASLVPTSGDAPAIELGKDVAEIVHGRDGIALGRGETVDVLDGAGQPRASLAEVGRLLRARLDAELDLAVAMTETQLSVIDLRSATVLARIDLTSLGITPRHFALAPDRTAVALADNERVAVFELPADPSGVAKLRARWGASGIAGIGFRQDAAVLFTGHRRDSPERAWDASTGELLPEQLDPALLELLALYELEIDPTWRWAAGFDRGLVVIRMLDGQGLRWLGEGSVASLAGLHDLRPGVGAWAWLEGAATPTLVDLRKHPELRHAGLLADFVGGRPLARPMLVIAE